MLKAHARCAASLIAARCRPRRSTNVSSADIQRLQDRGVSRRAAISRGCEQRCDAASRLQDELDDLRDEVIYLKVKLRKEGNVNRSDYTDVRDRLQDLRSRARADGRSSDAGWRTNSGEPAAATDTVAAASAADVWRASGRAPPSGSSRDPRRPEHRLRARAAGDQRDPGRAGNRRAARARADLGHRAGRRPVRGDDGRRPVSRATRC